MSKIEMSGYDFGRIMRACAKACVRDNIHKALQYIELRACEGDCVATSLDGFIMQQIKVPCTGYGVILIPGTLKPPRCERVIVEDAENVRLTYLDCYDKPVFAIEVPKFDGAYFDWGKIIEDRAEEVIHCNARNLRNALAAMTCADDEVISISIPHNKIKQIHIASNDVQAVVLPVRINAEPYRKSFKNWYKPIGGAENA